MKEPSQAEVKPVSRTKRVLSYLVSGLMFAEMAATGGAGWLLEMHGSSSELFPALFLTFLLGMLVMVLLMILMLWLRLDPPSRWRGQ
jgi:hypothetical protein